MNRPIMGLAALTAAALATLAAHDARAHGFAGDRFFPATILTDDPFVADEMSLVTLTQNPAAADGSKEADIGFDLAKRLTPDLGITFSDQWKYIHQPQPGVLPMVGFGALTTGVQYQLFVNAPHEAMALLGFQQNWAHTGRVQGAGAPDYTTLSPVLDWGKGLGDLPESLPWVRPFAITGNFSYDFPLKTTSYNANGPTLHPNNFNAGIAIEYSLEYLQHHVRDVGLSAPFDHMVPLIEIAVSDPLNRGQDGQMTGTIQPGLIWAGQYYQIGAEAIVPINSRTGHGYGGLVQFHLFLDDLFPNSIGRPIFGK
jgi:hypothetical protein